jgi:hypothetical protein
MVSPRIFKVDLTIQFTVAIGIGKVTVNDVPESLVTCLIHCVLSKEYERGVTVYTEMEKNHSFG